MVDLIPAYGDGLAPADEKGALKILQRGIEGTLRLFGAAAFGGLQFLMGLRSRCMEPESVAPETITLRRDCTNDTSPT